MRFSECPPARALASPSLLLYFSETHPPTLALHPLLRGESAAQDWGGAARL
jgi:hypothetical protein